MKKILKCFFLAAAITAFLSCHHEAKVSSYQTNFYELKNESASGDTSYMNLISPYKSVVDKEMNVVIGTSEIPLTKELPECVLGNFVADLLFKKANERYKPADGSKADFCVLNYGSLRNSLPQGDITKGRVFELMPFENEIVIVTLDGANTQKLFNVIGEKGGMPVSGMKMALNDKIPSEIFIGENKFDISKTYKIVTGDYLANGGDKMDFFKSASKVEYLNYKIRDAIIDYIREETAKGNRLNAKVDGRIHYVK